MLIFHPYVPGHREDDQQATWDALWEIRASYGYNLVDYVLKGPFELAEGLQKAWHCPGSLIMVEHDIVPTKDMIEAFKTCPEPLCAQAYRVYGPSLGRDGSILAHVKKTRAGEVPIEEGDQWASHVGTHLIRMRPGARKAVVATPQVPRVRWQDLWYELSERMGGPWHVHWPEAVHNHR